jgi:hypothetical protein
MLGYFHNSTGRSTIYTLTDVPWALYKVCAVPNSGYKAKKLIQQKST